MLQVLDCLSDVLDSCQVAVRRAGKQEIIASVVIGVCCVTSDRLTCDERTAGW